MYKKRVMDDLDALLADLESTTAHLQRQKQVQQEEEQHSREGTPPPLPPHPNNISMYAEPDEWHGSYESSGPTCNSVQQEMHSTTSVVTQLNPMSPTSPPYANLRYPLQNSQPKPPPQVVDSSGLDPRSSLSNNLSELDVLLQDLSSAQFKAELDRRYGEEEEQQHAERVVPVRAASSSQKPVDALLDELDKNDALSPLPNHYEQVPIRPVSKDVDNRGVSATTKDLDNLLASLSEFKLSKSANGDPFNGPDHLGEPPYAVATKGQSYQLPRVQNAQMQNRNGGEHNELNGGNDVNTRPNGSNLDDMLGTLSNDLSRQGVNTVAKGTCAACGKAIVGQVITALGQIWHPEHFACAHCKLEIGTQNFFERDGFPYCERDYHQLFSPTCALCHGPIMDQCITALDQTWHPEHFVCAHCQRPFGEDGFHEKDGLPYCRNDYYEMFAPKCGCCNRAIMDNYITAIGKQFHPQCFVCADCGKSFGNASFYEFDGLPYCENHYHAKRGSLCASCQKPITGRCITAMYKKFHPEHFVCAFCLKQLNKGTFKEQNDKPYCHPCFVKLFG